MTRAVYISMRDLYVFRQWLGFRLTLASGGGGLMQPHMIFFFRNGHRTAVRIALKFCIAYVASLAQLLAKKLTGQVRSRSYDVTRETPSGRLFKEVVFSAM